MDEIALVLVVLGLPFGVFMYFMYRNLMYTLRYMESQKKRRQSKNKWNQ